jgi:hypothetical protein
MVKNDRSQWVTGKIAAEFLGCSIYHLDRLRREGILKRGKHYRNIARPMAMRPSYRYNLAKLKEMFL